MGKKSPIHCDDTEALAKEVQIVEEWISKCHTKLLGPSDTAYIRLTEVFSKVQTSVDKALQKMQGNTCIEREEFCQICGQSLNSESVALLACDNCKDRYHYSCVEIEQAQWRAQKQFVCTACKAFTTGNFWLDEDLFSKACITKRPTIGALQELLEAAKCVKFRMKERELLEGLILRVQAWHACLHEIVEPILHLRTDPTRSSGSLLSALKIAVTMEVQEDENSKLGLAITINAWRRQAKNVLESLTKPSYRTVCRLVKEGMAMPELLHDCFLKDLKVWESMASEWVNQAKQAVEDNGVMSLDDVFKLIMEGEMLPVAFGKELTALRSRTVLYCICRKPYDKERAMIACDYCSDWYHFDCVNLPEPDSSDDECEDMLQRYGSSGEFVCPNCKNLERRDTSSFITELVPDSGEPPKDEDAGHPPLYTPPFWYARGKRSSRTAVKVKADLQERWHSHSSLSYCSKGIPKGTDCSQTCLSASGRPCRRTAGQHSRFESFVLLMHSG